MEYNVNKILTTSALEHRNDSESSRIERPVLKLQNRGQISHKIAKRVTSVVFTRKMKIVMPSLESPVIGLLRGNVV